MPTAQRKPRARNSKGQFKKRTNYLKATTAFVGNWLGKTILTGLIVTGSLMAVQTGRSETAPKPLPQITPIIDPAMRLTQDDYRQVNCLAQNIYFEARGEGIAGMQAVANVTMNRLHSGLFPDKICQVIYQKNFVFDKSNNLDTKHMVCQFSWYCDGKKHVIKDNDKWALSYTIAYNAYVHEKKVTDNTNGALYFHGESVKPSWRKSFQETVRIGQHIFYRKS